MLFSIITDVKMVLIVLTSIGALGGIILLFINRHYFLSQLRENHYLYLSLAFLIPIGIASIDALYPVNKFLLFYTMLPYVFIGILPIYVLATFENFKRLELLIVMGLLYISLDAIIQWLTGYHTLGHNPSSTSRIHGIFGEWAHLSYFLATLSPIMFSYLYNKVKERYSLPIFVCSIIILFILIIAIILGGARAGFITLFLSVFFFTIFLIQKKKIKSPCRFILIVILLLSLSIITASFIPVVQERFLISISTFGQDNFLFNFTSFRTNIWYVGFSEIPNYLFNGVGPRGFNFIYQTYPEDYKIFPYIYHPHLHGLEVIIEAGLVGFIPYIFICLYLMKRMITAKAGNMWLMVGFLALMPINSHVALYKDYWFPIVWVPIMIGLALAYQADQKAKEQVTR